MRTLLLLLALAAPAHAQTALGRVLSAEAQAPIAGALVVLLDASATEQARTLTDGAGRFALRAPAPGSYALRAEYIGRRPLTTPPFTIGADGTVTRTLELAEEAIALAAIEVEGEQRCRLRPEVGEATARLWDEARKALEIARFVDESNALQYRLLKYARVVDPETDRVEDEQSQRQRGFYSGSPFAALPVDSLARRGWYWREDNGEFVYNAPDARALLSETFLAGHCFRARTKDAPEQGLIGLEFEPVRRPDVPDVRGVLWLERATSLLRFIEYRYDRLPFDLVAEEVGGTVELERMPDGPIIVRSWVIRMPVAGERILDVGGSRERRYFLHRLREQGGEVLEVRRLGGQTLLAAALATLTGTVYDSVASRPLSGATVRLEGSDQQATAGAQGEFEITEALPGSYTVVATSPRLDSLGIAELRAPVTLRSGASPVVTLATPKLETLLAQSCAVEGGLPGGYGGLEAGGAVLLGQVRDSAGAGVPGATVYLDWTTYAVDAAQTVSVATRVRGLTVTADGAGEWRACDLPRDVALRVWAETPGMASDTAEHRFFMKEIARIDLALAESVPTEAVALDPLDVTAITEGERRAKREAHSQAMFIDRVMIDALEARGARRLTDVLRLHDGLPLIIHPSARIGPNEYGLCIEPSRTLGRRDAPGCNFVRVLLDGTDVDPIQASRMLAGLRTTELHEVEFVPPTDATFRYGANNGNGVLVITTRRR